MDRPRVMVTEQLISHVAKAHDMDDEELRSEVYTIFTAVTIYFGYLDNNVILTMKSTTIY